MSPVVAERRDLAARQRTGRELQPGAYSFVQFRPRTAFRGLGERSRRGQTGRQEGGDGSLGGRQVAPVEHETPPCRTGPPSSRRRRGALTDAGGRVSFGRPVVRRAGVAAPPPVVAARQRRRRREVEIPGGRVASRQDLPQPTEVVPVGGPDHVPTILLANRRRLPGHHSI